MMEESYAGVRAQNSIVKLLQQGATRAGVRLEGGEVRPPPGRQAAPGVQVIASIGASRYQAPGGIRRPAAAGSHLSGMPVKPWFMR